MEILIKAGQLILSLSLLVGLHELGHMLAAKFFGMRVEKFSIGFPPKIWGFKFGETEYSLGAIPLGGFVKISGMVDESLDTKTLTEEPQEWEFRAKPAWQRLIVMMGGIIINLITGIFIYIMISYVLGDTYISKDELNKRGIVAHELAQDIGLKTGDKILKVNGSDYEKFSDIIGFEVLLGDNSTYTVDRNGEILEIAIPNDLINSLPDKKRSNNFIEPIIPFSVGEVSAADGGAKEAGLRKGDRFVTINDQSTAYFHELKAILTENKGKNIIAEVKGDDGEVRKLQMPVSENGTLGFMPVRDLNLSKLEYSFAEAIPVGTKEAFGLLWANIQGFRKLFTGDVDPRKSIQSPLGIANLFGATWDWVRFWNLTGLLSLVLAFMNFLPIPALDGGHVVFLSYEMLSGRKPSDRFLENAQKVGMVLLLGLMSFAFLNDILKWFGL